jgi:cytidylate kinase
LKNLVIAIDGPAASGKSSTSKLAAKRLGYVYVDTGAMYRAMTLKVLDHKIQLGDQQAIIDLAEKTAIELRVCDGDLKVFLDNQDVTEKIRSLQVTRAVSAVSAIQDVRHLMVREQRKMGERGGIVVEGRDIGTVVFPNADLKIYMVADVERRAKRRQKDLEQQGVSVDLDELIGEIRERDEKDSGRHVSPLRKAEDAVVLDTSTLSIEDQVEFIVKNVEEILQRKK